MAAYLLSTVTKAQVKGKTFRNGFSVGFWAFEHAGPGTKTKIESALAN